MVWLDTFPEPRRLWGDEGMYWDAAVRLAAGQSVALEPLWPPLYPHFMAGVLRVVASRVAVQVVQLALLAASAWLLYDIGRRLTASVGIGAVAAVLLVLDPQVVAFTQYFWPEILHLFLALAVAWMLVSRQDGFWWSAAFGAAIGLALLSKNLLGPFVPVLIGMWLVRHRQTDLLGTAVAVAALVAVIAPTAIDNHHRHGAYFLGDSARFNVLVGLTDTERRNLINDAAGVEYGRYLASAPRYAERNVVLGERVSALVQARGVSSILIDQLSRQYFRLFDHRSFFTDQLPGGAIFEAGAGYRTPPPALVPAFQVWSDLVYAFVLISAPFGLLLVPWRTRPAFAALAAYVGYVVAVCLLVHVKTRYRVQIVPALYLASAVAMVRWPTDAGDVAPVGMVAATAGAIGLLFLAFGGAWLA